MLSNISIQILMYEPLPPSIPKSKLPAGSDTTKALFAFKDGGKVPLLNFNYHYKLCLKGSLKEKQARYSFDDVQGAYQLAVLARKPSAAVTGLHGRGKFDSGNVKTKPNDAFEFRLACLIE